ncbi:N-alpha-acetyltransferase 30 [Mortierella alpina]|nr:N-alpha-acetyltransferase 30 [Mortierella alpina]
MSPKKSKAKAKGNTAASSGAVPNTADVKGDKNTASQPTTSAPALATTPSTSNPASKAKIQTPKATTALAPLPPIEYVRYESEHQLSGMMSLIENDLSEPYSIYTYRYFLHQWPKLSFLAMDKDKGTCIGVVVCRLEPHGRSKRNRGYIAMLAVSKEYRKRKIGSTLVLMAIEAMKNAGADEIVLETEYTNQSAIALYQQMGFIKDKRLYRYYLNGIDAFRLKLFCRPQADFMGMDGLTSQQGTA